MSGPQGLLHPIRPSVKEEKVISELHAILRHWFVTMPEAAREEAAGSGLGQSATGLADEVPQTAEDDLPWTWSACTLSLPDNQPLTLPPSVAGGLFAILSALVENEAVAVVPMGTDLTTQEAANLLGVSRPYLVRLIDQGLIPCSWVGSHRRLRVEDILTYRRTRQGKQRVTLRELAETSEALGLRYSTEDTRMEGCGLKD